MAKEQKQKKSRTLLNVTEITAGVVLGLFLFILIFYLLVVYLFPDKFGGNNVKNEDFSEFKDESLEDDIENLEDV